MKLKSTSLVILLLSAAFAFAAETIYHSPVPEGGNPAAVAAPRDDWYKTVQDKFTRFGNKHADIVFDGDSITNRWENAGKEVWNQHYASVAADFGIEGDRVENVLWRLSRGQVDGIDPKVVVLMIGTNNSGRDTADQIAEGIKVLVAEYERRCPNAHIILMGIFPRGPKPSDAGRQKVATVNTQIASLDDGNRVSFVDITSKMLESDGTLSPTMAPDFLHPTAKGYQIWSDAIQPIIDKYVSGKTAAQSPVPPAPVPPTPATPTTAPALVVNPPVVHQPLPANTALITFSGLYNGSTPVTNSKSFQGPIPASYQPLMVPSPQTQPVDGASFGVTINWDKAGSSNHGANGGVKDHTGDNDPTSHLQGGGIMYGTSPFTVAFNPPVEIPSFFWTYYFGATATQGKGSVSVYTHEADPAPAKSVDLDYQDAKSEVWHETKDFAGIPVAKIVFDPGMDGTRPRALNIDDIMVHALAESAVKP